MTIEPDADRWNHGGPPDPDATCCGLMHVLAEAWPLAADHAGIWALTRDTPLMTDPLADWSDVYGDLERELARAQMISDVEVLHQTSSRLDRGAFVATHVVVLRCEGPVRSRWPDALPVPVKVAAHVGNPPTHGAAELPTVRQWDVVTHLLRDLLLRGRDDGIGHLAFQVCPIGDAGIAEALDRASPEGWWGEHLARWAPVLYQMYSDRHVPESA